MVRGRGDESKRDTSGRDTNVVPTGVDATRRWLSVLTDYAPLRPLMRPFRVVYAERLKSCHEDLVKVRIQGIVADHRLDSPKAASE